MAELQGGSAGGRPNEGSTPASREPAGPLPARPPRIGELVEVRSRRWLVEAQDFDAPAPVSSGAPSSTGVPSSTGASGSAGVDVGVGVGAAGPRRLEASPQSRTERLLRTTGVPSGLLFNGITLRLISAPRGESSGWMDFRVADMSTTAGRPLCSALRLLLSEQRLLALPRGHRLSALLEDSRKYQNEVSERLAEQVLHALYELVRGLQAAHDVSGGELLREPLSPGGDRDDVYRALLSVILRLVFLLYAEERGALPEDDTFLRHYSLTGLYERLREDVALHPDTMDQRFGAWAQLLVLFRLIHDGAPAHRTGGALTLPERRGALFDPDRFPFLEGRYAGAGVRQIVERVRPPLVSDGAVYRVLEKLLVLDGERISYRTLDVEQIGSVYETIMGFRMEVATGRSVAVRPAKKLGAPNVVDLDALLAEPKEKDGRARWLQARTDRNVTDTVAKALRAAATVDDLHAALDRVQDKDAAPDLVPPGALVLQPTEERRRSGSHYTPRELTEPIVRHALAPLLDRLRGDGHDRAPPTPARILDLKVCDPSMGSGAFLVETCRQLADALIEAWGAHGEMPAIPPDEDEVIFARRLVAQRCLYGIDRNPMAVDLAKVSLWLSTLARDHPLTFVDHAFRHGDSLVGLTRRQIEALDWAANARSPQRDFKAMRVGERMAEAAELRRCIREAGEETSDRELHDLWHDAHDGLDPVRLSGDPVLAAFFAETKPKPREARRRELAKAVLDGEAIRYLSWLEELRRGNPPLAPFHWEIEFPEVFGRENPGFDAFVGNPPFAGKNAVTAGNVPGYPDLRHVINFRDWPLRREDIGDSREGIGESREDSGESRADADDERDRHPSRPERVGGSKADSERRYPGRREDGAESWMDTDEERRRELRRQPIVPHDYPEPVAADWPELLAIVEERVKPGRAHLTRNAVGQKRAMLWWQYGSLAKELYAAVAGLDRVLAISRIGQHAAFTFLPKDMVYAETTIIFPFTTHAAF